MLRTGIKNPCSGMQQGRIPFIQTVAMNKIQLRTSDTYELIEKKQKHCVETTTDFVSLKGDIPILKDTNPSAGHLKEIEPIVTSRDEEHAMNV